MNFLKVEKENNFLFVRLNRPDVRNAFHPEMIREITEIFSKVSLEKPRPRAVVLSGEGKSFCSGADLNWMQQMVNFNFSENKKDSEKLHQMFTSIQDCPVPVIGVVQGVAMGGALGLISVCDYVLAVSSTQFCFSEVKIGLVPAVISPFILAKAAKGIVAPLMMFGDLFSAERALQCGLIHEIIPDGDDISLRISDQLQARLKSIGKVGPEAILTTKKMLRDLVHITPQDQKELTTRIISERRMSDEGQDGLKSFLNKGIPKWQKQ